MMGALAAGKRLYAAVEHARPLSVCRLFERLDELEIGFVRRQAAIVRLPVMRRAAVHLNLCGTFWLYPALAIALAVTRGWSAKSVIEAAALAVLVSHAIYPLVKTFAGRLRPCDNYPGLAALGAPLDRYSFPSGHSMTASAAFVPIGMAFPELLAPLSVAWLLLAWARMATAHHYPSDVACGAVLGGFVSLPISYAVLH